MVDQRFVDYLLAEKRYSGHTAEAYSKDITQFYSYFNGIYGSGTPVLRDHIRSWIASLMSGGLSPSSVNRKLSSLRTWFRYLVKTGQTAENPASGVPAPKKPKRLPEFVREDQIRLLLDEIGFGEGFKGIRNLVLFELLYATGIRRAELVGLTDERVDLEGMFIKVTGKGGKERVVPLAARMKDLLMRYLEMRNALYPARGNRSFLVTDRGGSLYPRFVHRVVSRFLAMVTTIRKKSPHILRHTFATHLSDNGADINAVKELLGHASLAATQVYTHNSISKLLETYKKAHPKAKDQ